MSKKRDYGQGSLYRRKGCARWIIQYYVDGQRKCEPTGLTSRVDAQKLLTARLAAVNRGEAVATIKQVRVRELWENRMRYAKGRTIKDAKLRWKRLEPFFGGMLATRVTPQLVMEYRAQRAATPYRGKLPTVATINRELEALRRAYRQAQQDGLVQVVPHIHIEAEDNTRTGFVPDAKVEALRRQAGELWLRTMVELGCSYGWRKGEMLGLTVGQLDFAKNVIRLEVGTTKNKQAREVPLLPGSAVRTLLQQCCHGKQGTERVLTREDGSVVKYPRVAWERLPCAVGWAITCAALRVAATSRTRWAAAPSATQGSGCIAACWCMTCGARQHVHCATQAWRSKWR
jgi:integrase